MTEESPELDLSKMSFLDHLEELRQRIIRVLIAVVIGAGLSFAFAFDILKILTKPAGKIDLVYLSPLEPFMVKFKIALWTGIFIALPIILYQLLAFIVPALKKKERRMLYPAIAGLVVLFAAGVAFGYNFIMPIGIKWLFGQAGGVLQPNLTASSYVNFAGLFLLAFGASFETPMFILLLIGLGVLSPQTLREQWRVAYVVILVIAAAITPDWSPVTMAVMALPMVILYEISVFLGRFIVRKREQTS